MSGVLGAILAGGRATRYGSDKALAEHDGRTLLDWVMLSIGGQVEDVVICGRDGGLPDRPGGSLGPLAGLNAALHAARERGFEAVLSVPCDAPHLPADLLARLRDGGDTAYLEDAPVIGLWPALMATSLDTYLTGEDRSMRGWARRVGAVGIRLETPIVNINRPADLALLPPGMVDPDTH